MTEQQPELPNVSPTRVLHTLVVEGQDLATVEQRALALGWRLLDCSVHRDTYRLRFYLPAGQSASQVNLSATAGIVGAWDTACPTQGVAGGSKGSLFWPEKEGGSGASPANACLRVKFENCPLSL